MLQVEMVLNNGFSEMTENEIQMIDGGNGGRMIIEETIKSEIMRVGTEIVQKTYNRVVSNGANNRANMYVGHTGGTSNGGSSSYPARR